MRRHAKASSAGSTSGIGSSRVRFGRAFATRGASGDAAGSGAPLHRAAGFGLALLACLALVLAIAPAAQATSAIFNSFGSSGVGTGQFSFQLNTDTRQPPKASTGGVAVNSSGSGSGVSTGDVYTVDRGGNRVEQFSSTGNFVRAWGYDVVRSGQDNSGANEHQTVTIPASVTAGTFTLTLTTVAGEGSLRPTATQANSHESLVDNISTSFGAFHVGDLLSTELDIQRIVNLPVTKVIGPDSLFTQTYSGTTQTPEGPKRTHLIGTETTDAIAYNANAAQVQAALEALPGVGVSGVTVSGGGAGAPFVVTFSGGGFTHNDIPQMSASSSLTGGAAMVLTSVPGGGFEICNAVSSPADVCKTGTATDASGAMNAPQGIAVDQANGNVYVSDQGNRRIAAYAANGTIQGTFGYSVVPGAAEGTGTLTTAEPNARIVSSLVTTKGAFAAGRTITGAGIPAGTTIVDVGVGTLTLSQPVTASGSSVSLAVAAGAGNVPTNEKQTVTLTGNPTGGVFKLTFTSATLTGTMTKESNLVTSTTGATGTLKVGDVISGGGFPAEAKVVSVDPTTGNFTVNQNATESGEKALTARETTATIPFNASPAELQAKLEGLAAIGVGNVSVSGGGGAPWVVEFKGIFADINQQPLSANGSELTPEGKSATTATQQDGAAAYEFCATGCQAGVAGAGAGQLNTTVGGLAVAPAGAANVGNLLVADTTNNRVDEFHPTLSSGVVTGASFVRGFGFDTIPSVNERQIVTLAGATGGTFKLTFNAQTTAAIAFNAPATGAGSVQTALQALSGITTTATVSGEPGGPYTVTFAGAKAGLNQPQMTADASALTPGGATANVATITDGSGGPTTTLESCATATTCKAGTAGGASGQLSNVINIAEDAGGSIFAVNAPTAASESSCSASSRCAVLKYNAAATSAADFAPAQLTLTSGSATKRAVTAVAIDPVSSEVYAAQANEILNPGPEYRILRFNSAGVLQETALSGASIGWQGLDFGFVSVFNSVPRNLTPLFGLAYDPSSGHTLFATTEEEQQRVFVLASIPASAKETLSASLDDPAVTGITTEAATINATVTSAHGIAGHTFYEFEYTNGTNWIKAPRTDAGNGSGTGSPESCPTENPPSCEVAQTLSFESGQEYKVRLHVFVPSNPELSVITPYVKFKTLGVPPTAETSSAWWSSPADTHPNMTMRGFVNPRNEVTSYYFQYVSDEQFQQSGYETAHNVPLAPGDPAAKSFNTVEVQQTAYELDASKIYHYRLVAVNPTDTAFGGDRTIVPPKPGERFYELVSTGNSGGLGSSSANQIADHANRIFFIGVAIDNPPSSTGTYYPKVSERTSNGWKVITPAIDPDYQYQGLGSFVTFSANPELSEFAYGGGNNREANSGRAQFFHAGIDGTSTPASPVYEPLAREATVGGFLFGGGVRGSLSENLSRQLFTLGGGRAYIPGEPLIPSSNLYLLNSETFETNLFNVDTTGKQIGGVCGAEVGGGGRGEGSISLDGSVGYFSARPGAPLSGPCDETLKAEFGSRIYKREGMITTEVSASQCSRPALPEPPGQCKSIAGDDGFQGASRDGSVVFFNSPRQLTNSDTDSSSDLYVYDSNPPAGQPNLVQASAGEVTAGHPTVGSGAEFVGVFDMSTDGSRVYFVAKGQLTSGATAGQNNLYVYERDDSHPTGRVGFIGTVSSSDSTQWGTGGVANDPREVFALPTGKIDAEGNPTLGDGHFLVFTTVAKLLPEDLDSAKDIYRYDDLNGQLLCISCSGSAELSAEILGHEPGANPGFIQQSRIATEDVSEIVFRSEEPLVPADHNSVEDVYLWNEGALSLITGDTGELGVGNLKNAQASISGSSRPMISLDGKDIYFNTSARLVPSDTDTDVALDAYDARIGGGFPEPKPEARVCIDGEVCRGATTAAPGLKESASSSFTGKGNPEAKPSHCAKGKVRRHGRCIKPKKKQHHKRSQRKASENAGGNK